MSLKVKVISVDCGVYIPAEEPGERPRGQKHSRRLQN